MKVMSRAYPANSLNAHIRFHLHMGALMIVIAFLYFCVFGRVQAAEQTNGAVVTVVAAAASIDPIHQAIREQLQAFKDRDAVKAFAVTSATLKSKYADSAKFLRMARFTYKALYDHRSYQFLKRTGSGEVQFQPIEVMGPDGLPAVALFRMVRDGQAGHWLIDQVIVLDEDAQPI